MAREARARGAWRSHIPTCRNHLPWIARADQPASEGGSGTRSPFARVVLCLADPTAGFGEGAATLILRACRSRACVL
jgi:hypothetical protein